MYHVEIQGSQKNSFKTLLSMLLILHLGLKFSDGCTCCFACKVNGGVHFKNNANIRECLIKLDWKQISLKSLLSLCVGLSILIRHGDKPTVHYSGRDVMKKYIFVKKSTLASTLHWGPFEIYQSKQSWINARTRRTNMYYKSSKIKCKPEKWKVLVTEN